MGIAQDYIRELAKKLKERPTPEVVLKEARPVSSPIHEYFEWDNKKAGHLYRLDQARTLIRTVTWERPREGGGMTVLQTYVHDFSKPAGEAGYVSLLTVRSEEDTCRATVIAYLRRAESALGYVEALADKLGLAAEVADLLEQLDALQERVVTAKYLDERTPPRGKPLRTSRSLAVRARVADRQGDRL